MRAAVMSCTEPGSASEIHSGNPSGASTARILPPWRWALPEYHRSDDLAPGAERWLFAPVARDDLAIQYHVRQSLVPGQRSAQRRDRRERPRRGGRELDNRKRGQRMVAPPAHLSRVTWISVLCGFGPACAGRPPEAEPGAAAGPAARAARRLVPESAQFGSGPRQLDVRTQLSAHVRAGGPAVRSGRRHAGDRCPLP
jgi:hypothetical protein